MSTKQSDRLWSAEFIKTSEAGTETHLLAPGASNDFGDQGTQEAWHTMFAFKVMEADEANSNIAFILVGQTSGGDRRTQCWVNITGTTLQAKALCENGSTASGSTYAYTPNNWYYCVMGMEYIDSTDMLKAFCKVYSDPNFTTNRSSADTGYVGYTTPTFQRLELQINEYYGNLSAGDKCRIIFGPWLTSHVTALDTLWSSFIFSKISNWEPLTFDATLDDFKVIGFVDESAILLQESHESEIDYDGASDTPQTGESGTSGWAAYLDSVFATIAANLDKVMTLPTLALTAPPPFDIVANIINDLWNDVIGEAFEVVTDVIINALKALITSGTYLVEESVEAAKGMIEDNADDIAQWAKTIINIESVNPTVDYIDLGAYLTIVVDSILEEIGTVNLGLLKLPNTKIWPKGFITGWATSHTWKIPTKYRITLMNGAFTYNLDPWEILFPPLKWTGAASTKVPLSEYLPFDPDVALDWDRSHLDQSLGFTYSEMMKDGSYLAGFLIFVWIASKLLTPKQLQKVVYKIAISQTIMKPSNKDILDCLGVAYDSDTYSPTGDSLRDEVVVIDENVDAVKANTIDIESKIDIIDTNVDQIENYVDTLEEDIRGADGDDLKQISDEVATLTAGETLSSVISGIKGIASKTISNVSDQNDAIISELSDIDTEGDTGVKAREYIKRIRGDRGI